MQREITWYLASLYFSTKVKADGWFVVGRGVWVRQVGVVFCCSFFLHRESTIYIAPTVNDVTASAYVKPRKVTAWEKRVST